MEIKNDNRPKFSIITVTKNSEKYLEKNLLSVQNQTLKNFEHIIVDGNSKDKTKLILKKHKTKLKIISENDDGLYDAMNKGIKLAQGDIIGILNSDDYYYPKALKIIKNYFSMNPNIDFVFGSVIKYNKIQYGFFPWKIYWTFGFYSTHSVGFFIKKESQKKLGFYNTKYKYSADYDLFYRMIVKKKMKGVATKKNEVIGYFRPGGISDKIKYIDYLNENTRIRLDNKQNYFLVMLIHLMRYLKRVKLIISQNNI
jgi:glycosyltransferase involved in cell wall biosynthesis